MKSVVVAVFATLASLRLVQGKTLRGNADQTPIVRVLNLIRDLKVGVEYDGKMEQKTYDKYACWCEATLERKATDIANAKALIETLGKHILKLNGEIGAHGAEIASLKKWIGENQEAQTDATQLRDKENADYETEKMETEQCIGALESAIKTLTGAGEGKGGAGFLELRQAQIISAAQGIRRALSHQAVSQLATDDMQVVSNFLEKPADFVAMQTDHKSPFGEYAPASGKLQGILKGMYDAFTADLEKSNGEEANKQKAYEEYIATKTSELTSNQATLETHELDKAAKGKDESDSQTERDDTQKQLKEDENYFELTKQGCREKAMEWNERSRIRSEELVGINKAIEILESPEAQQEDANEKESLLQQRRSVFFQLASSSMSMASKDRSSLVSRASRTSRAARAARARSRVWTKLAKVAAKYGNFNLAQIAAEVRAGGHFDKVIKMMDDMIVVLRKEEQSDIKHRDLCQNNINKNNNDIADAEHNMQTATATVNEMTTKVNEMKEEIKELERLQGQTNTDMEEKLEMRNKEREYFEASIKDDVVAADTIRKAMASLVKTAEKHASHLFVQVQQGPGPEYTVDSDKAPELAEKKDRSGQMGGIITVLETIVTDIDNDVAIARKEDEQAQKEYEEERQGLKDLLHAQKASVVAAEQTISDAETTMNTATEHHLSNEQELAVQKELQVTLNTDCDWVAKEFDNRRAARKAEVEGLQNAKSILAGAASGDSGSMDELVVDSAR